VSSGSRASINSSGSTRRQLADLLVASHRSAADTRQQRVAAKSVAGALEAELQRLDTSTRQHPTTGENVLLPLPLFVLEMRATALRSKIKRSIRREDEVRQPFHRRHFLNRRPAEDQMLPQRPPLHCASRRSACRSVFTPATD
jgi:hypothetical protein